MYTDLTTDPRAKPREIDHDAWWRALECLPPLDWRREAGAESFTLSEPYDLDANSPAMVYWRYVRIGDRYWEMLALRSTPITDLAAMCKAAS